MPLCRKPFISLLFRMTPLHRSSCHGCWIQRCFCRGRRALRIGFSPWEAAAPASSAVAVLAEMSVRNFLMNLCSLSRRERARFSKKTGGCVIVAVFSGLFLKAGHLGIFSPAIFLLGSFLLQQRFFFFSLVGRDLMKASSMSCVWMICSI